MKFDKEIQIGIFVVICVIALLALTVKVGNFQIGKEGYQLKAQFKNINGVETGSPVMLSGLEVGQVKGVELAYDKKEGTKLILTLWLEEEARVRQDSKVSIKTMGLMGEKYIEIDSGTEKSPFLAKGSLVIGEEPFDLDGLIAKSDSIADNLDKALEDISSLSKDVSSLVVNLDDTLHESKDSLKNIIYNFEGTSKNLEEFSDDIRRHPWKLMFQGKEK